MDDLTDDIADGFGIAALHLQNSILTALVAKGYLTMKDCALTVHAAHHELNRMNPTSLGHHMHASALQSLSTLAQRWDTQAKGN